jgi:hypothetical protein
VAFLESAMILHAQDRGQDRTQPGGQGLEFKGQVQIGVHKAKLEANTLYQVVVGHPKDAPVYVNADYPMRLTTDYSKNSQDNKIYCVPPKSGEYTFTVSPQGGGAPKSGAVDYTLSLKAMPFEDRLALEQRAAGSGDEAGAEHEVAGDLDHAAGMNDAHGDAGFVLGEARQVGFAPDDGEGAPIDLGAVAGVIVLGAHGCGLLADWSKASI